MACTIHAEPNDQNGDCPSCLAGSPPDLGISIDEDVGTEDKVYG